MTSNVKYMQHVNTGLQVFQVNNIMYVRSQSLLMAWKARGMTF